MSEKLATAQDVADVLRLDVQTVRRYARDGKIPHTLKVGGEFRFDLEEVVNALKEQEDTDERE